MGRRLSLACWCLLVVLCLDIACSVLGQTEPASSAEHKHKEHKKHSSGGHKCKPGRHGMHCSACPKGYYTTDGKHCQRCSNFRTTGDCENGLCTGPESCTELGCPVGTFKAPTSSECEPCPVGEWGEGGYPYPKHCTRCPEGSSTLGKGSYSHDQCVPVECPAGSERVPGGVECQECAVGSYSEQGQEVCSACPDDTTTITKGAQSVDACVCAAGYEPYNWFENGGEDSGDDSERQSSYEYGDGGEQKGGGEYSSTQNKQYGSGSDGQPRCSPCTEGTYKSEAGDQKCEDCPWPKTTKALGSTSVTQCVCPAHGGKGPNCDQCPGEMVVIEDGTCGCPPGTGGSNCEECKRGFFSTGGRPGKPYAKCKSCGPHFTSPAGSPSAEFCECVTGFGASPDDDESCVPCALGTFNPGSTPAYSSSRAAAAVASTSLDAKIWTAADPSRAATHPKAAPCQKCGAAFPGGKFTTAQLGSTAASDCECLPGHGGTGCAACQAGTYSEGGAEAVCHSCPVGAGYTTWPQTAATSAASCVCLPGYGISSSGVCALCQPGTYSPGGKQACQPCEFGTTSKAGASGDSQCVPVAQECPVGQVAPPDAVSKEQCGCYPGYGGGVNPSDPCTICPVGTWSRGGDLEACVPCKFGFTSARGSTSSRDCYPLDQCPAGTDVFNDDKASSVVDCRCKPGHGSPTGEGVCRLCPPGFWSAGGTYEDCKPCPFSLTSPAGSVSEVACVPAAQPCPVGQIAGRNAVSKEQCGCLPGYGGGETPSDACKICPPGTWARGGDTQACRPCGFGYTSAAGATSDTQCYPTNACPAGTEEPAHREISSVDECVCRPGFGLSSTPGAKCSLCPSGTYSPGGSLDQCRQCPFGTVSRAGATHRRECELSPQACPIGQWAPEDAVSREQCVCYPGYGGGNGPSDPCTLCPAGSYSPGRTLDRCVPCEFGTTSPVGSTRSRDCYPTKMCPPGTRVPHNIFRDGYAASAQECRCKPGYGSPTGSGTCRLCPAGFWSAGGTYEDCKPCPWGTSSRAGAEDEDECRPVAQQCPVGQIAPPDAQSASDCGCLPGHGAGESPDGACHLCSPGSWSPGGAVQPCIPCGFGFTSPEGAMSAHDCHPINACPAGTEVHRWHKGPATLADCVCKPGHGLVAGTDICRRCPHGTFAPGGTKAECQKCAWDQTSPEGATSSEECRRLEQPCPIGQWAPPGAPSAKECRCFAGFGAGDSPSDPCTICPAGFFSEGKGLEKCMPCGFGYTSLEGASSEQDCYPTESCPAGTVTRHGGTPSQITECKCKRGYGSANGAAPCHRCPAGYYGEGGSFDACLKCPWGRTSAAGSGSIHDCVASTAQRCPVGQIAPPDAVSEEECACLPGFGGGQSKADACRLCAPGFWSPGGSTQPCLPCSGPARAYTGPTGATSPDQCREEVEYSYSRGGSSSSAQLQRRGDGQQKFDPKKPKDAALMTDYRGSSRASKQSTVMQRLNQHGQIVQQAEYRSAGPAEREFFMPVGGSSAPPQRGQTPPEIEAIMQAYNNQHAQQQAPPPREQPSAKPHQQAPPAEQPKPQPAPATNTSGSSGSSAQQQQTPPTNATGSSGAQQQPPLPAPGKLSEAAPAVTLPEATVKPPSVPLQQAQQQPAGNATATKAV